jgi:hypothetical protein
MNIKISAGGLIVAAILTGHWYFSTPAPDKAAQVSSAATAIADVVAGQQTIPLKQTVTVEPGRFATYSWEFSKTPGRLYGSWISQGRSANIRGATDDTLVSFKLVGANNEILQNLDHPASGNFDIHITSPGRYTFWMGNTGMLRSSSRVVTIDATYKPD